MAKEKTMKSSHEGYPHGKSWLCKSTWRYRASA